MACLGAPPTPAVEQTDSDTANNPGCIRESSFLSTWHTYDGASALNADLAKKPATLLELNRLDDFFSKGYKASITGRRAIVFKARIISS